MADYKTVTDTDATRLRHQCMIYKGPPSHKLKLLANILHNKLKEGYRCLYLNSAPMVAGMRSTLAAMDIDVEKLSKDSLILSSDVVSKGRVFNSEAMLASLEDHLDEAIRNGFKGLWASGDMTWEFGSEKDFSKLMEYEVGLEEMFRKRNELCGICQYHYDTLPQNAIRQSLLIHETIVINETLKIINPHFLKSNWPADAGIQQKLDEMINELCGENKT